jgi:hypothetical protein
MTRAGLMDTTTDAGTLIPCRYCPTWFREDGPYGILRHAAIHHPDSPLSQVIDAVRLQVVLERLRGWLGASQHQ